MPKFLNSGWSVVISFIAFLALIVLLPSRNNICDAINSFFKEIWKIYGGYTILLVVVALFFILTLILYIIKKKNEHQDARGKKYSWKIIGFLLIFIFLFDFVLFKTVAEAISKSDSAVILAVLAIIVSEEKLLHNFVVLNDEGIEDDKTIVSKKFTVITITSLVVISSSAALLQSILEYFRVPLQTFGIIIIVMAVQLIILIFINKHIKIGKRSIIYRFFKE